MLLSTLSPAVGRHCSLAGVLQSFSAATPRLLETAAPSWSTGTFLPDLLDPGTGVIHLPIAAPPSAVPSHPIVWEALAIWNAQALWVERNATDERTLPLQSTVLFDAASSVAAGEEL